MATTYKTRYGLDWPVEANDVFIKLFVAKKWREILRDRGVEVKDPWEPLLEACTELFGDGFRRHRWAEEHAHDWVTERGVITWGCSSCGKAVPLDEVVYFPDGPGTMRDVAVGSSVVSATGRPAKVTAVYDQDGLPLYRVRFADGAEVVCCGDHLWTVRYRGRVRWDRSAGVRRGVAGWREETVSARRLASWTRGSLLRRQVSVPLTRPVEFTRRPVPLDPYVLGCLVGGGSLHGAVLLASRPDDSEVRDEVSRRLPPGLRLRKVAGDDFTYQVTCGRGGRRNGVVDALRSMGLMGVGSGGKFVPDEYMHNSLDVRLDLLAGLMDAGGCVDGAGRVSFSTVSPRLRDQVRELLESVGMDASALDRYPHEFSGGQRQRICIARAIAAKPDLLVCDEAVSALDLSVRAQTLDLLAGLRRRLGLSMLFITHDLGVVRHVADRVIVLSRGRIVEEGECGEVLSRPRDAYTRRLVDSVCRIFPQEILSPGALDFSRPLGYNTAL